MVGDGSHEHLAGLRGEGRQDIHAELLGLDDEQLLVLHLLEEFHVVDELGLVDRKFRVQTLITVGLGGDRLVVDGGELLHQHPCVEVKGERAFEAGGFQLLGSFFDLFPCVGLEGDAGFFESVDIVIEHRGRRIIGEGVQFTRSRGVIIGDAGEIIVPVDLVAIVGHQLLGGNESLGQHHVQRAGVINLGDGGLLLGAIGGNGVLQGGFVIVLRGADDLEFGLGVVELLAGVLHAVAEIAGKTVPEFELGLFCLGGGGAEGGGDGDAGHEGSQSGRFHELSPVAGMMACSARTSRPRHEATEALLTAVFDGWLTVC